MTSHSGTIVSRENEKSPMAKELDDAVHAFVGMSVPANVPDAAPAGYFRDSEGKVHPIHQGGGAGGRAEPEIPGKTVDRDAQHDSLANNPSPQVQKSIRDIAQQYLKTAGLPPIKDFAPQMTQPEEGKAIATAYENARDNPRNPDTKASYAAFNKEVKAQYDALVAGGFKIEPWEKPGQPYQTSTEMKKDVDENHHIYYFKTGDKGNMPNKLLTLQQNDMFRAVHDIFGHAQMGNQFGPVGETNAYLEHSQMFSPQALPAMTTETLGQNSTYNFGKYNNSVAPEKRKFPVQKATLLPKSVYAPLLARRDAAMTKSSFAHGDEEDYFNCPCHQRPEDVGMMAALHSALGAFLRTNAPVQFVAPAERFFRDAEGRVHPIVEDHPAGGVSKIAHLSEHALLTKLDTDGGFTFHTHTGEQPTTGYAVSAFPDREKIFDGVWPDPADLHHYMAKNDDLLQKSDHFLGGWNDKDNNKVYLDVSIINGSKPEAESTARKYHQEAYFDLDKGEDVRVGAREEAAAHARGSMSHALDGVLSFADEPTGFFRDSQGKVHPIMGGGGTGGPAKSGWDGKQFNSEGDGKPLQVGRTRTVKGLRDETTTKQEANTDAMLKQLGLTRETLAANYKQTLAEATPDEIAQGKAWYPGMHEFGKKLAESGNMPLHSAIGVIAGLSPHNSYERNLEDAKVAVDVVNGRFRGREIGRGKKKLALLDKPLTQLTITPQQAQELYQRDLKSTMKARRANALNVQNYHGMEKNLWGKDFTGTHDVHDLPGDVLAAFVPHLGALRNNMASSMVMARGGDPDRILLGSKVRSFYNNGLDPEHNQDVTIDTHMIALGQRQGRTGYQVNDKVPASVFGGVAKYKAFADAVRQATPEGMTPSAAQAIMWLHHKNGGLEKTAAKKRAQMELKMAAPVDDDYQDTEEMDPETLRAVIAEDKLNQREALKWYLRNTGQTHTAYDFHQALKQALGQFGAHSLAATVHRYLLTHGYPAKAVDWVAQASWKAETVPVSRLHIDAPADKLSSPLDSSQTQHLYRHVKDGGEVPPIIIIQRKDGTYTIVDGHHRALVFDKLHKPTIRAYVGTMQGYADPWSHQSLHAAWKDLADVLAEALA